MSCLVSPWLPIVRSCKLAPCSDSSLWRVDWLMITRVLDSTTTCSRGARFFCWQGLPPHWKQSTQRNISASDLSINLRDTWGGCQQWQVFLFLLSQRKAEEAPGAILLGRRGRRIWKVSQHWASQHFGGTSEDINLQVFHAFSSTSVHFHKDLRRGGNGTSGNKGKERTLEAVSNPAHSAVNSENSCV